MGYALTRLILNEDFVVGEEVEKCHTSIAAFLQAIISYLNVYTRWTARQRALSKLPVMN